MSGFIAAIRLKFRLHHLVHTYRHRLGSSWKFVFIMCPYHRSQKSNNNSNQYRRRCCCCFCRYFSRYCDRFGRCSASSDGPRTSLTTQRTHRLHFIVMQDKRDTQRAPGASARKNQKQPKDRRVYLCRMHLNLKWFRYAERFSLFFGSCSSCAKPCLEKNPEHRTHSTYAWDFFLCVAFDSITRNTPWSRLLEQTAQHNQTLDAISSQHRSISIEANGQTTATQK